MAKVKEQYSDLERVRYYQDCRTTWVKNPISQHWWPEHTPIQRFVVVGPFGECCITRSEKKAIQEVEGWQAYYDKYGQEILNAMRNVSAPPLEKEDV